MEKIYKLLQSSCKEDVQIGFDTLINHSEEEIIDFMMKYQDSRTPNRADINLRTKVNCPLLYIKLDEEHRLCIPDNGEALRLRWNRFSSWETITKKEFIDGKSI